MYICTYDIVKNKTRTKVSKILEDYGVRVQYSVFEFDASAEKVKELHKKLSALIDKKTDSVNIYYICSSCEKKQKRMGEGRTGKFEDSYIL